MVPLWRRVYTAVGVREIKREKIRLQHRQLLQRSLAASHRLGKREGQRENDCRGKESPVEVGDEAVVRRTAGFEAAREGQDSRDRDGRDQNRLRRDELSRERDAGGVQVQNSVANVAPQRERCSGSALRRSSLPKRGVVSGSAGRLPRRRAASGWPIGVVIAPRRGGARRPALRRRRQRRRDIGAHLLWRSQRHARHAEQHRDKLQSTVKDEEARECFTSRCNKKPVQQLARRGLLRCVRFALHLPRRLMSWSTTAGSASVEVSPS